MNYVSVRYRVSPKIYAHTINCSNVHTFCEGEGGTPCICGQRETEIKTDGDNDKCEKILSRLTNYNLIGFLGIYFEGDSCYKYTYYSYGLFYLNLKFLYSTYRSSIFGEHPTMCYFETKSSPTISHPSKIEIV